MHNFVFPVKSIIHNIQHFIHWHKVHPITQPQYTHTQVLVCASHVYMWGLYDSIPAANNNHCQLVDMLINRDKIRQWIKLGACMNPLLPQSPILLPIVPNIVHIHVTIDTICTHIISIMIEYLITRIILQSHTIVNNIINSIFAVAAFVSSSVRLACTLRSVSSLSCRGPRGTLQRSDRDKSLLPY